MTGHKLTVLAAALIVGAVLMSSCSRTTIRYRSGQPVVVKKGPPPHAPAHGYRHKHGNVFLVYKSSLGVYVVNGHAGHYFYKNNYYRSHKGAWQISVGVGGPWKKVKERKLPKGLRHHKHAKAKHKKH